MKVAFLLILFLHALIHSLGFIKAFEFKEIKELSLPISQPAGMLWLLTFLLLMLFGFLHFRSVNYAWLIGCIAVLLSQSLIFFFWEDAKFGTLPNALILVVSIMGLGSAIIQNEFAKRVNEDFSQMSGYNPDILTESDISHLPMPVQDYLRYTRCIGKPKVENFYVELEGVMRNNPEDKGMQVSSIQYNFTQNPSRYFLMEARKMGLPARGIHLYQDQKATFRIKLLNWLSLVDEHGPRMDQGETVTVFNDMCVMAPASLIDPKIEWKTVNDSTVSARFTNGDISISADLHFNPKHELVNFISHDRYEIKGKEYKNYPWSTPIKNYKPQGDFLLPSRGTLIYHKPEGDFTYGELEILHVSYNLNEM